MCADVEHDDHHEQVPNRFVVLFRCYSECVDDREHDIRGHFVKQFQLVHQRLFVRDYVSDVAGSGGGERHGDSLL